MGRTLLFQHLPVAQAQQRQSVLVATDIILAAVASNFWSLLWCAALLEGDIELRLKAPSLLLRPVLRRLRLLRPL